MFNLTFFTIKAHKANASHLSVSISLIEQQKKANLFKKRFNKCHISKRLHCVITVMPHVLLILSLVFFAVIRVHRNSYLLLW